MAAGTIFGYCTIMLTYDNKRENDGVDLIMEFFYRLHDLFIYLFIFLRQKKRMR